MRKFCFALFIIFIFTGTINAQPNNPNEMANLANLCKVWGFLKYYHPTVAKGKIEWDSVLIELIPKIKDAGKAKANTIYLNLLQQLGTAPIYKDCKTYINPKYDKNLDLNWLGDGSSFTAETVLKLNHIRQYRNQDSNYYVSGNIYATDKNWGNAYFVNEKQYKNMRLPNEGYRLLSLFRFWNIIEYYYPCKYSLKEDWNSTLKSMIPVFINAKDTLAYDKALRKLVYSIHDSHSDFTTRRLEAEHGNYHAPFYCEIVEGKVVVTRILNDSICKISDIKIGDVINSWNNEKTASRLQWLSKEIPASNQWTRNRDIFFGRLLAAKILIASVTFSRNGRVVEKNISCIDKTKAIMSLLSPDTNVVTWKKINKETGYVHLGNITDNDVDTMMIGLKQCNTIIFDLRAYPKSSAWFTIVEKYLYPAKKDFAIMVQPDYSYPGMVKEVTGEDAIWKNVGADTNPNCYKGKIIVLINEQTQSQAEFAVMALQAAPNTITIGTTTAGTDGDISSITFVGGLSANMSGIAVYYPDGRETQRVGIKPNIEVRKTVKGIKEGKDEILEAAVNWVMNNTR
jgi:carboxyl-terminal processing protease